MKRWLALLLIAAVLLASGCTAARQDRLYLYGVLYGAVSEPLDAGR